MKQGPRAHGLVLSQLGLGAQPLRTHDPVVTQTLVGQRVGGRALALESERGGWPRRQRRLEQGRDRSLVKRLGVLVVFELIGIERRQARASEREMVAGNATCTVGVENSGRFV